VVINNTAVPIAGGTPAAGGPSFRTALSAGDRNTLALAFFFASLDQRRDLADHVVVIDDPISSLDEHRELTTVQEVRRLTERAGQVIVLSHSKPFLCRLWEGADRAARAALEVSRDGAGSTLRPWDVNQDSVTEHDRRHLALRQYLDANMPNNREVAAALRPVLEASSASATLSTSRRPRCSARSGTSASSEWAGRMRSSTRETRRSCATS